MSEKKWYVLRTAGTKEKKVADYLQKEVERNADLQATVDQILVPVKKEIVTKNGKRKEVDRILYPGYVLIHAELNADLEYIVRGRIIPGLANAVNAAETEVNFSVGESVRITDGPFSGFNGTIEEILEDRSKLKVIVVIFGRKTLLELSFTQVTKE